LHTSAYSLVTVFGVTMLSLRGTRPQPPGPNALLRIRRYLISGRYTIPSGLISTSSGAVSARRISAASLGKGSAESPWNERVQSIFSSGAASSSRGLSASPLLEMLSVVVRFGVGAATRDEWVEEEEGVDVVEEVGRGAWLVVPLVLVEVWDRVELYVMARLVMEWEA
jgi:hypothetical protein